MIKQSIASFFCGALFSVGLALAGMTQPAKIVGFLNVFGAWDYSLVFVLASAVGVYYIAFQIVTKRKVPVFALKFNIPTRKDVDLRSVTGGLLFGLGWGISGLCPGPILSTLGTISPSVIILMITMLIGLWLSGFIGKYWQ